MKIDLTYSDYLKMREEKKLPEIPPPESNDCVVPSVIAVLQGKWKNHILFVMCRYGTLRFGELKNKIPNITNTVLSSTLRELEEEELINRKQFNEIPPHVEYSLTKKGEDLMPIFFEMFKWGMEYLWAKQSNLCSEETR
jgi:Predicted transcriptional regulators